MMFSPLGAIGLFLSSVSLVEGKTGTLRSSPIDTDGDTSHTTDSPMPLLKDELDHNYFNRQEGGLDTNVVGVSGFEIRDLENTINSYNAHGLCNDMPHGWHDSDGPSYDCQWYAKDKNCARYGNIYENMGKVANEACCACGGGSSTSPHLISLSGENRACRGGNSEDNSAFYYVLYQLNPNNIDECFKRCYDGPICYGVEYEKSSGRCEVWNRMPRATANANGYECYINRDLKPNSDLISLRGENKACRGDNSGDNSASYYSLYYVAPNNIDECLKLCYDGSICHGVEYAKSSGRCEVWNRMPLATANVNGYECYVK